jgi:hypothetical protein
METVYVYIDKYGIKHYPSGRIGCGCFTPLFFLFLCFVIFSPFSVTGFFLQRAFISPRLIKVILKFSLCIIGICLVISAISIFYHWLRWDDFTDFFLKTHYQISSSNRSEAAFATMLLIYSLIGWSILIPVGILHLIFSTLNSKLSKGAGYGLLNLHCVITRQKPSRFLTRVQDGAISLLTVHFCIVKESLRFPLILGFLVIILPTFILTILRSSSYEQA